MNTIKILFLVMSLIASSFSMAASISGNAADFTLKSLSGKNIKLSEYRGDVVMVNFWASWCGPCRQEMPALEQLYKKYKDLGFVILGVNLDEDSSKAAALLKKIPVSFPILYDSTNKVAKLYDVKAMPTTYLIDRNGKLRYLHKAYKPGYEIKYAKEIKTLIRE
ncbi:MAG: TlpA family protein disulfide reductase [Gammaproteobacteria bacterium]|nr:TlpA family protein disulfide reductase [Gammaproteobacteria bacterium]